MEDDETDPKLIQMNKLRVRIEQLLVRFDKHYGLEENNEASFFVDEIADL